jgi:hypothetical protein
MLALTKLGADFSQECAGRRIGNGFPVTRPSSRRETRLGWARTVGKKRWAGVQYMLPTHRTTLTTLIS